MKEKVIEIIDLKKYYGDVLAVNNLNLTLYSGELYGFIGPNGAGKSTTIRSIMNLINITAGKIFINNKLNDKNDLDIKRSIGYLPSEINLYSDLKVKEIFDFHESFYKDNIHSRREELVNLFNLDESKKIIDLSLGNLKKVGIILAFMHNPQILILDEPTSGLDPIMQNTFFSLLEEEKKKGTTILYSTHILSEVTKICDRIGIIKEGMIIKEDSVENFVENNVTYLTIESLNIKKIKEKLPLKIIEEKDNKIKFYNTLKPNELMKLLSRLKIDRMLIEEVPLEELVLDYYK